MLNASQLSASLAALQRLVSRSHLQLAAGPASADVRCATAPIAPRRRLTAAEYVQAIDDRLVAELRAIAPAL